MTEDKMMHILVWVWIFLSLRVIGVRVKPALLVVLALSIGKEVSDFYTPNRNVEVWDVLFSILPPIALHIVMKHISKIPS